MLESCALTSHGAACQSPSSTLALRTDRINQTLHDSRLSVLFQLLIEGSGFYCEQNRFLFSGAYILVIHISQVIK